MRVERVYDWRRGEGLIERDPQPLDLAVRRPATTRVGHLSDTHLGKENRHHRRRELRRWLETLEGLGVDLIVHSGDVVDSPDDEEAVDDARTMLGGQDVPCLVVPGNHDVRRPGEKSVIAKRWGPYPRAETVGELRISLLDSMAHPPVDQRSEKEQQLAEESGFFTSGALGPKQIEAWDEQLDEPWTGAQLLVVHHHPRQPVPEKPWYEQNADLMAPLRDADEMLSVARRRGIEMVLHGHRHQYVPPYAPFDDLVIVNGGSVTRTPWPKRLRIIDVADQGGEARIWELVRFS